MTDHASIPSNARPSDLDAKLAAEIEAALGDMSIDDLLEQGQRRPSTARSSRSPAGGAQPQGRSRERKTGRIAAIHSREVLVEFGPKLQGTCPIKFFEEKPVIGTEMEFIVDRMDREAGLLLLSRQGAVQKADWENLEVGQVVEARCTGTNKGGLEMEVANHKAFMPAGQVDVRHIPDLSVFVGQKFPCEVAEVNRERARIILSRKKVMEGERTRQREKLLESLEVGAQLPALIVSLQPYGAFADLGGLDGLIHISDLAYERIRHPSEVLKEGQQVTVKVLKIDRSVDPPKLGLGLKQTMEDPVAASMTALQPGGTVSGRVTKIMPFGAFVQLAPGVEGLIHISELSHDRVHDVKKIVKQDEIVTVKVLSIDPGTRRIALSLKALKEAQAKSDDQNFDRGEDPTMRKMKAALLSKFGGNLKGGIG